MNKMASDKPLRKGWTTGACATAATCAAYIALRDGVFPDPVTITLPKGQTPAFVLNRTMLEGQSARASVIKDAGDDPDVTHGAEIISEIRSLPAGSGIVFKAGTGVGTVTRPGLPLAVGEPAINPVPRQMMVENLTALAGEQPDLEITISIAKGEELALQTMNPRLGIVGGLSVLGTTGIVVPYSCAAWIHSIHRGVDVARAVGLTHIGATTGSTSEKTLCDVYPLEETALIDMGDFAGGLLKYLRRCPVEKLTLCGGFAKLCKLAQGELDLHSSRSRVDLEQMAKWIADCGGDQAAQEKALKANTALEVLEYAQDKGYALGDLVAKRAREAARAVVSGDVDIEIICVNRKGEIVGRAS